MKKICFAIIFSMIAILMSGCLMKSSFKNNTSDSSINTPPSVYSNLSMINTSIGWIVKDDRVLRTKDGCKSFKDITPYKYEINTSYDEIPPLGVYFYDSNTAWISLGTYTQDKKLTIYHTLDGGGHWNKTYLPVNEDWEYLGSQYINFINNKVGFILVTSSPALGLMNKSIYKTIDGGVSWKKVGDITDEIFSYPTGVTFSNDMNGWITSSNHGQNFILAFKTINSGVDWNKENLQIVSDYDEEYYTNAYPPIFFKDNGKNGVLPIEYVNDGVKFIIPYITNNGGYTWCIPSNFKNYKFTIYNFMNEKKWWALDQKNGKLYVTNNSGENWNDISENKIFKDIKCIEFVNENLGFAIADHILIKTVDGGKIWSTIK